MFALTAPQVNSTLLLPFTVAAIDAPVAPVADDDDWTISAERLVEMAEEAEAYEAMMAGLYD